MKLQELVKNIGSISLSLICLDSTGVLARDLDSHFIGLDQRQNQITNVSNLRDVAPSDWAYEALQNLVERYGCVVGYPDSTYKGNRSLSRWEFAAGLNACLNNLERLIEQGSVTKEDLEKLNRLTREFQNELASLGAKITKLDERVAFLENHQFSTTTKLNGEIIFSLAGASQANNQVVLQNRVRLTLDSSFGAEEVLHTRLSSGNFIGFNSTANLEGYRSGIFSPQTALASSSGGSTGNNVGVDWIAYQGVIHLTPDTKLDTYVSGLAGSWNDFIPTVSPYFGDSGGGSGSLLLFSQQNPIYYIGGGSGAGFTLELGQSTTISLGYLAGPNPNIPTLGNGLTNGSYGLLGQINTHIGESFEIGFTYVNAYQAQGVPIFSNSNIGIESGAVGSPLANGLVIDDSGNTIFDSRKVVNSYGLEFSFRAFQGLTLIAFGNYTNVNFVGDPNAGTGFTGTGEVWSYGAGLAFSDLGKEGAVLGFFGGVQPYFGNVSTSQVYSLEGYTTSAPVHLELFYKYPLNDNFSITPGFIWLSNPTQTINSNSQIIGVLRGTFKF